MDLGPSPVSWIVGRGPWFNRVGSYILKFLQMLVVSCLKKFRFVFKLTKRNNTFSSFRISHWEEDRTSEKLEDLFQLGSIDLQVEEVKRGEGIR